jgi:oligoribonuclease
MTTNGNLVWLDLETTGLNPQKDKIVEISTVITDSLLNVLAEGPNFVIHYPSTIISEMSDWSREHFALSGLLDAIHESTTSLQDAEKQTLDFIKKYCPAQTALLAGSSVHFDKEFLRQYMPKIVEHLHYRIIDVSTIKELAERWYPDIPTNIKVDRHRAHDDILESIDELKYYKARIFV